MSSVLHPLVPPAPDEIGVVHENTRDLVDVKEAGRAFRVQGNHIIVGEGVVITDRRPKAIEAVGRPHVSKQLRPTHIYPRNRNKYDHKELERQRVLRSLAKEKSK